MKYLDPKADLTFKKVFGKHPDLLISLLNALLPLNSDEQIQSIEYLPTELVPELYAHKNSIVDVLCEDVRGRKFCVYVTQAMKKDRYADLQPVYSLNLVNDVFEHDMPERFIHHYKIVHEKNTDKVIEGLHFTFIELPKFTPQSISDKRMMVLWLRYLTEINAKTKEVSSDLLNDPQIGKALEEVKVSAFTEEELRAYDKFWDSVRVEKSLQHDSFQEGKTEGLQEGEQKGIAKGIVQGIAKEKIETAKRLMAMGLTPEQVAKGAQLPIEQVMMLQEDKEV